VSVIEAAAGLPAAAPSHPDRSRRRPKRGSISRWIILVVCGLYFVGPLLAAFLFTIQGHAGRGVTFSAYRQVFAKPPTGQQSIQTALWLSVQLSLITIAVTLALLLPTMLLLHLRFPRVRPVVELLCLLPLVFPPVVLVVGVSDTMVWTPNHLSGVALILVNDIRKPGLPLILAFVYVILCLPYTFRALDAGIRSVDVRTLVEASRNLGSGWATVLFRILLPTLRTAVVSAAFLCFALVMGEYTIAKILLYRPFSVWLVQLPATSGQLQVAASMLSLLIIEVLLLLIGTLNWRGGRSTRGANQ
jgi:putative spermidine/putrescine transport system permease protein